MENKEKIVDCETGCIMKDHLQQNAMNYIIMYDIKIKGPCESVLRK